jgi:diguanylate cyclase (GGDEF)-like protein/PAS domain S-box-containing protein
MPADEITSVTANEDVDARFGADGLARLYDIAPIGLCYLDADLRFRYINQWLANVNGISVAAHYGKTIDELLKDVAIGIGPQLREVLETGVPVIDGEVEVEAQSGSGETLCYRHSFHPDKDGEGKVVGVSVIVQDITAKKKAERALDERNAELELANERLTKVLSELKRANQDLKQKALTASQANIRLEKAKEQLQRLALFDTLTGLGNRNLFMQQLAHLIALAERNNQEVALLEMDLDGFKGVNDRLGHAAGDEVLREFSARLARALRKADQKYRIGGDEFAVLLEPRFGAFEGAIKVAEQIAKVVSAPMEIKGHSCSIGVSIGIAVYPEHGREPNALLRKADAAMYQAKKKRQVVAGASKLDATTVLEQLESER